MADSASELESDTSSIDGTTSASKMPGGTQYEQLQRRLDSLQQENRVLKMELETHKLRCKQLQEENKELRKASVTIVGLIIIFSIILQPKTIIVIIWLIVMFSVQSCVRRILNFNTRNRPVVTSGLVLSLVGRRIPGCFAPSTCSPL
jgi:hypothetical protein